MRCRFRLWPAALLLLATASQAWNAADDERNRQRAMAQMRRDAAQFEINSARTLRNMQRDWDRQRSSPAPASSSTSGAAAPTYSAVGQLGATLGSLRERMNQAPALRVQAKAETDQDVFTRLLASAEQGSNGAAFNVGRMYYAGFGTARDDARAAQWFKRAGELGHADGAYHYGYMRQYGHGVAADPADAVAWYQRAAAGGSARGELSYAAALLTGQGVARNEAQAIPLLKSLVARNMRLSADPDIQEAQALSAGLLGDFYRSGTGVPQDMAEAIRWYALAAERGDMYAARDLAKIYYQGEGVAKDAQQFLAWTAKAAQLGHPEAEANLGLLLVQGQELPKDIATGVRLVQDAAAQNDGFAWSLLGSFYQDGVLPKSPAQAAAAYRKAVALGYAPARSLLTPALVRVAALDDSAVAVASDRQAAQAQDANALLRLGDRYADGVGLPENLASALNFYERAAQLGQPVAMGMQGLLLMTGQAGVTDLARGIALTRQAAAAGDAAAMFTLGQLYEARYFGAADAAAQARQWYQLAGQAGHAGAGKALAQLP